MIKKHNEGYALVLVLVVMVVLTTVSLAVMSFSLRNLQSQQASVDRMAAKYAAQGEIEKIVGQLEWNVGEHPIEQNAATESDAVKHWFKKNGVVVPDDTTIDVTSKAFEHSVDLSYDSSADAYTYTVNCTILVTGTIELKEDNLHQITGYTISDVKVEYTSYEIGDAAS